MENKTDARWDISEHKTSMSKVVENIINQRDENYPNYGSVIVSVRNTDTDEVRTSSVDYNLMKDEGSATAEAIEDASNKF